MTLILPENEANRKALEQKRQDITTELNLTPDQRGLKALCEAAKEAGSDIAYRFDQSLNEWIFEIGGLEIRTSDHDVAAMGIGVATQKGK